MKKKNGILTFEEPPVSMRGNGGSFASQIRLQLEELKKHKGKWAKLAELEAKKTGTLNSTAYNLRKQLKTSADIVVRKKANGKVALFARLK